jgi:hypothetical protein
MPQPGRGPKPFCLGSGWRFGFTLAALGVKELGSANVVMAAWLTP